MAEKIRNIFGVMSSAWLTNKMDLIWQISFFFTAKII